VVKKYSYILLCLILILAFFSTQVYAAVWGDYYDSVGDGLDVATAIAVKGDKVFVTGYTETSPGGYAFTVRAYSAE